MSKKIQVHSINLDTTLSRDHCDNYKQTLIDHINKIGTSHDVVNLTKIELGHDNIKYTQFEQLLKHIKQMFKDLDVTDCVFIPVGESIGIKNVTVDAIEVPIHEVN